jgi:hypothetical protein
MINRHSASIWQILIISNLSGNSFIAPLYRDRYFQFCPGIYIGSPIGADAAHPIHVIPEPD